MEIKMEYQYTIAHPTTVVLAGPTKCGKTQFLLRVLREGRIQVSRHFAKQLYILV